MPQRVPARWRLICIECGAEADIRRAGALGWGEIAGKPWWGLCPACDSEEVRADLARDGAGAG